MKRILLTALILTVFVSVAMADWIIVYKKPFGNLTPNKVKGAAADTLFIPISVVAGAKWMTFRVNADSAVPDSVPKLTVAFGFKGLFTKSAWIDWFVKGAQAGYDTIFPKTNTDVVDSLTTEGALIQSYSARFSAPGDSARVIILGKHAGQQALNCTLEIRIKK